jgi:Leucine-rich repeat (LRR) protein
MTLAEKAEAVRNHLKEKRGSYTDLQCSSTGMLCFPIEFCSLQNLQGLDINNNQISALPPQIGQLVALNIYYCRTL